MHRSLPAFGLILLIVCAGCLGGLGFGGSGETPTTTTNKKTQTQTTVSTTIAAGESTTATTTTTETQPETRMQTSSLRRPTTARIDTPKGSERFQARVTTIIDPTTIIINHDGTTQIVELIGASVPENGTIQMQALRYTNSQLDHQVVTVVSDPRVDTTDADHLQAYVYIGNFMFNTDLVRIGYARVPDGQFSKRQEFMTKQQEAKQRGSGRWNTTTIVA